jgi:signal transduction histidine kinase
MLKIIRRHLGTKFFVSYIIVILIGILVLISATEFIVPDAFERHLVEMARVMGPEANQLENDLFTNFRNAVNESLVFSAVASSVAAIIVSLFVSRQVVAPIRRVMIASQRIAEGHYSERVQIPGGTNREALDELAQLSVSFNQMALKLEQGETLRKQLIGDIAHELRTPLSTIKGFMEGLMDGILPASAETYLQVHQEAERLQRLVDDLQDLNRVEAGVILLNLEENSIKDLVGNTQKRLIRQFDEKGVSIELNIPEDLPMVSVDRDRMGQVFINIVGNSLQYTPAGGNVMISAKQQNNKVMIIVTDTGIGISSEDLPQIFTRFFRVDKSRSRAGGGSGIGLTISKHLVEAHGGEIWAESAGAGKGSKFTISLPV